MKEFNLMSDRELDEFEDAVREFEPKPVQEVKVTPPPQPNPFVLVKSCGPQRPRCKG
jgi:hypothetical protein